MHDSRPNISAAVAAAVLALVNATRAALAAGGLAPSCAAPVTELPASVNDMAAALGAEELVESDSAEPVIFWARFATGAHLDRAAAVWSATADPAAMRQASPLDPVQLRLPELLNAYALRLAPAGGESGYVDFAEPRPAPHRCGLTGCYFGYCPACRAWSHEVAA